MNICSRMICIPPAGQVAATSATNGGVGRGATKFRSAPVQSPTLPPMTGPDSPRASPLAPCSAAAHGVQYDVADNHLTIPGVVRRRSESVFAVGIAGLWWTITYRQGLRASRLGVADHGLVESLYDPDLQRGLAWRRFPSPS